MYFDNRTDSALDTWTVIEAVFYRQRFVTFGSFKFSIFAKVWHLLNARKDFIFTQ